MNLYLNANLVIYFIEQPLMWGLKTTTRIAQARTQGDYLVVSDLTRMEAQVGPLRSGNTLLLGQFAAFFKAADVRVVSLTAAVCDRAAMIRAHYGFKPLDSIHLAAAIEHGCDRFLTNDVRLGRCAEIPVEVLP